MTDIIFRAYVRMKIRVTRSHVFFTRFVTFFTRQMCFFIASLPPGPDTSTQLGAFEGLVMNGYDMISASGDSMAIFMGGLEMFFSQRPQMML